MKAFVFPGQSSQKLGMGKDMYEKCPKARVIFEQANDILGERFSDFLFNASEDVLMDTRYTQPAIFIYQVAAALGHDAVLADGCCRCTLIRRVSAFHQDSWTGVL